MRRPNQAPGKAAGTKANTCTRCGICAGYPGVATDEELPGDELRAKKTTINLVLLDSIQFKLKKRGPAPGQVAEGRLAATRRGAHRCNPWRPRCCVAPRAARGLAGGTAKDFAVCFVFALETLVF
jgi:hypothetical protein